MPRRPAPEDMATVYVRLTKAEKHAIEEIAREDSRALSAQVRHIVREFLLKRAVAQEQAN